MNLYFALQQYFMMSGMRVKEKINPSYLVLWPMDRDFCRPELEIQSFCIYMLNIRFLLILLPILYMMTSLHLCTVCKYN